MTLPHPVEVILGPPGVFRFVRVVVLTFTLSAVSRLLPVDAALRRARRRGRRRRGYALWAAGALAAILAAGGGAYAVVASHHSQPANVLRQGAAPGG